MGGFNTSSLINALIVVCFMYSSAFAVMELVVNQTSKAPSGELAAALLAGCCFGLGEAAGTKPGVMPGFCFFFPPHSQVSTEQPDPLLA